MPHDDPTTVLREYLTREGESLRWKLEGLSEYDLRERIEAEAAAVRDR